MTASTNPMMKGRAKTKAKLGVSEEVLVLLREAKGLAQRYYTATGKPLGVTGEIAEYEASRLLGVTLAEVRQRGYDATKERAGRTVRFQIKDRC